VVLGVVRRAGHGELLRREHVVGLVDAGGIGRHAFVAGADPELLGGEDVVGLFLAGRVRRRLLLGHGGNPVRPRYGVAFMEEGTRTELEAAAFRRLLEHLRERKDVQNIELMELAGFCRNCLSKWYRAAAEERGVDLSDADAREIVYGMPYEEWKARFQTERA
jgi:uncharacterized protein